MFDANSMSIRDLEAYIPLLSSYRQNIEECVIKRPKI